MQEKSNFKIELNYTNNKEDISTKEEILSQEDPYNENKEVKDKEAKGAKIFSIDKFRKDIK